MLKYASGLILSFSLLHAQPPAQDPGGVLRDLAIAKFAGSGRDSIQAMTADAAGNLYVAGTTSSPDLRMKNAAQPALGEATLMRSTDAGLTWQKVAFPAESLTTIKPHPADPKILFAAGRHGIFKTTDGGEIWRQVRAWTALPVSNGIDSCCITLAIDPANPRVIYAYMFGLANGFLASTDGGDTWQVRSPPANAMLPGNAIGSLASAKPLWVDPNGSGTVALGLWLSRDRGVTWAQMAPLPIWTPSFTVPDPRHPGWIYGATAAGTGGHLYLSKDWGISWQETPGPLRSGFVVAIGNLLFDPDLPATLYATDFLGGLSRSDDGGLTWTAIAGAFPDFGIYPALLTRQCSGGALLISSGNRVVANPGFGADWRRPQLSRLLDLATGPGCAVYAVRSTASDAFVARLSPAGDPLWSTFLGGMDADTAADIRLDADGNVYVTGNTSSPDFPATQSRIGEGGRQDVFVVRLNPDGQIVYSAVLGGEESDTVTTLAADASGNVYVAGRTDSLAFPTTAGVFEPRVERGTHGFVIKLDREGQVTYATYLRNIVAANGLNPAFLFPVPTPGIAITTEPGGSALIGGYGATLSRISADGSTITALARLPGQIYTLESGRGGSIYAAGQTTAGASSEPCFYGFVYHQATYFPAADIFLMRLEPETLKTAYAAKLSGLCRSAPGPLSVASNGEVTLGLWSWGSTFPLRNPLLASAPECGGGRALVARFTAAGSALQFSSYVDMCGAAPAVASGPGGALYAGVTSGVPFANQHGAVLRLPVLAPDVISVESVWRTLNGAQYNVQPGTLLTISGERLSDTTIDLGLNHPDPLPYELGGVQVLFDGKPARIFQVTPEHVICVVPDGIANPVTIQLVKGTARSTPFLVLTGMTAVPRPALLTRSFPFPPDANPAGTIRNADGSLNDEQHPAAMGSTVTLYADGLPGSGQVELLWAPEPPRLDPVYIPGTFQGYVYGTASPLPGFISALSQIKFRIPDALGPGVKYLPPPGVVTRVVIALANNTVGVYVK